MLSMLLVWSYKSALWEEENVSCGYLSPPYKAEDKEGDGDEDEDEDEDLSYDTNDSTIW